ncbi:MAG: hypothetical protein ABJP45_08975 [Cyclobacteriaceae bacterium]
MDEAEFDLLDELYFVTSFSELRANTEMSETKIQNTLVSLASKGWICVYENSEEEVAEFDLISNFKSYFYLASKKGLLAHNKQ